MAIKRSRRRSSIITNTPIFLFILSCFCIIMEPFSSHAVGDTITKDQYVTLWDPLISSNGNFKLGFFKPGRSDNYFLGIWYNKSPEIKPVWVANRNSPIYDTSGALAITDDGILYITDGSNFIVLNSNQGATFDNLTAKLLDSGNFVLSREVSSSKGSDVLWQSFDYPTDTILDGMKVGLNLKTGQTWSLTSWLSYSAPAPGAFTLGIDPNGTKQLVLWQRGEVISTSGIWHNGSFPEDYNYYFWGNYWRTSDSIYNISYVSTVDEKYFTFSQYKNDYYSGYSSTSIRMGVLDPWGLFSTQVLEEGANFYTWGNNPEIIGSCKEGNTYNYQNHGVCMVHKRLDCSSSPNEEFSLAKGFFGGIASLDLNLGISDCDAKCRSNCSCIAYSSFYDNGTGCVFWYKELGFTTSAESGYGFDVYALTGLLEDQGNDGTGGGNGLPTLNSTSGAGREKKKQRPAMQSTKTWWWLWSIMAVAPVVTVLLFGSLCYLRRYFKLKGEKKTIQKKFLLELGTNINMNKIGKEGKKGDELQIFSFNSITSATANFSSTNKLGEGGFGPVYKGKLLEGQEIAVKRLSRSSGQGQEEFKNEIVLIAKLQHMNLVRLLGCCIHVDEKMLIYEYMPNNSLDFYLFDPTKKKLLDWKRRLNIIEGIAQGLLYLHKFSRLRVIHRDLKASNILLDAEMNPKISDFGMARIFGRNESEANTNRVVGT